MRGCLSLRRVVLRCGSSGRAPADGVPFSANVPRPAASSFISLRKAPRQRVRWAEQSLISVAPRACPSAQGIGCSAQRNKGGGAQPRGTFAEGSTRWPLHTP